MKKPSSTDLIVYREKVSWVRWQLVRLANISARKALKTFQKFEYTIARQKGSHIILKHPHRPTLTIPNHKELAPGLMRTLISQAGLRVEDFLDRM